MADVFVSYAHRDVRRVEPISKELEAGGLSLWWDKRLRAGDDFSLVIERELQNSGCVVVAWSDAARNSLWVRAEATEALDQGKIVQVRLDGVKPPLPFTIVQMLDMRRWRGGAGKEPWPALVGAIKRTAAGQAPVIEERAFRGPALQDMGGTAFLGWVSLALVFVTSFLTVSLVNGNIGADLYATATGAAFAVSVLAFILTGARLIRTALATGRS